MSMQACVQVIEWQPKKNEWANPGDDYQQILLLKARLCPTSQRCTVLAAAGMCTNVPKPSFLQTKNKIRKWVLPCQWAPLFVSVTCGAALHMKGAWRNSFPQYPRHSAFVLDTVCTCIASLRAHGVASDDVQHCFFFFNCRQPCCYYREGVRLGAHGISLRPRWQRQFRGRLVMCFRPAPRCKLMGLQLSQLAS